jgi:hypothetical protein
MAIIAEVAALNHRLVEMGYDSEKHLNEQLTQAFAPSDDKDGDDFAP